MQEKATIARPYARAAFEHAQHEGKLAEWSAALSLLARVVSDPQMRKVILHPKLSEERLSEFIFSVCGDRLPAKAENFVKILVQSRRLAVAPEIFKQFEEKRAESENRVEVEVVSAFDLEGTQADMLAEIMQRRLGLRINVSTVVEDAIIGGIIIRAGDSVIDASLRGRLRRLGNELAK